MKISTYTEEDKRKARKEKFKRKSPKKPKQSSSLAVKERWIERYNSWVKDLKTKARECDKRESDKMKAKKIAEQIRRA